MTRDHVEPIGAVMTITQGEAVAILRDAIEELRSRENAPWELKTIAELGWDLTKEPPLTTNQEAWKRQIQDCIAASREIANWGGMGEGWAYTWILKPWAESLVGWYAAGPCGRAAGEIGYRVLIREIGQRWIDVDEKGEVSP